MEERSEPLVQILFDFGLTGFADFISPLFLRGLPNFFTAPSLFGIFLLRHGVNSFALNFGVLRLDRCGDTVIRELNADDHRRISFWSAPSILRSSLE
jgi:hypothetical protein